MPQMSPLLWLFLMLMIVVSYCLFAVLNYFIVQSTVVKDSNIFISANSKDWRW